MLLLREAGGLRLRLGAEGGVGGRGLDGESQVEVGDFCVGVWYRGLLVVVMGGGG